MTVGYLVNQYPQPSQSFIRREIAALEAQGVTVERFTVRRYAGDLADPADVAERNRTAAVLDAGPADLVVEIFKALLTGPGRFFSALKLALRCGGRANRRLVHFIYLAEACRLLRMLREKDVAHVHAHFGTNSATVAMLCRALGGPPFSFTVHGPEEFDSPAALSLGEKVARSKFAVAVSQFGRSQLYRWSEQADWPKIHVVHCGIDRAFLDAPAVPPSDRPEIVCVGRLAEQKGQLILLEACRRLAAEGTDFHLTLAGDGPMRGQIEAFCRDHELTGRVSILGWQSNAQIRQAVLNSRFVTQPSFAEGLPVAIMEALALRRAVVTTYVAGIPELVIDAGEQKCGWLVPAGSVDALAAALRAALQTDQPTLEAMGAAGATRVRERHDVGPQAAKLPPLFAPPVARIGAV